MMGGPGGGTCRSPRGSSTATPLAVPTQTRPSMSIYAAPASDAALGRPSLVRNVVTRHGSQSGPCTSMRTTPRDVVRYMAPWGLTTTRWMPCVGTPESSACVHDRKPSSGRSMSSRARPPPPTMVAHSQRRPPGVCDRARP